jgi:hypothetical protein
MTPQELNRNRWLQLSGAADRLPPPLGSLLQRLRLDCFRSSTDPPSVISGEVFALLSLAPFMQRADYERA